MIVALSGEEKARAVIGCFRAFGIGPGETLSPRNFVAIALRGGVPKDDITAALTWGYARGWFENTVRGSVRLTETGFAAHRR